MARQEDEAAFFRRINVIYTLMSVMATQYDLLIYKLTRTRSNSSNRMNPLLAYKDIGMPQYDL